MQCSLRCNNSKIRKSTLDAALCTSLISVMCVYITCSYGVYCATDIDFMSQKLVKSDFLLAMLCMMYERCHSTQYACVVRYSFLTQTQEVQVIDGAAVVLNFTLMTRDSHQTGTELPTSTSI